MAYQIKGKPFEYKGAVNVTDCKTAKDVMEEAGLAWTVAKCRLLAQMPLTVNGYDKERGFINQGSYYEECPNAYATYRTDCNIPLGIVKERYTPVQNIEAFNFFDKAIGKDKALWQTAGFFGNGERIFVSAKLPRNILVDGDPVENYLVFTTSHDGSSGVKILFTPIRVICQNTLNAAIRTSTNYVSFRHTSSVHRNIDIADEILGICNNQINMLSEYYNEMKTIKLDDKQAKNVFGNIIFNENELANIANTGHTLDQIINKNWSAIQDSGVSMRKVNAINAMTNYYFTGPGQRETLGNAWGVYGAVTGYYSNVDNSEGIKRMDSILFGDKARKIELSGNMLLSA